MCFPNFTVRFSSIAKLTVMDADYAISFHRGSVVGNFLQDSVTYSFHICSIFNVSTVPI